MELDEIRKMLMQTGFPVAYSHFNKAPTIPFITYTVTGSDNFDADNRVYFPVNRISIELYTDKKDLAAEKKVETALSSFCWEKTEIYIDSEKLYQITYEIEV